MGRNQNSDNEFWEEYEKFGKNFVGSPDELEELVDDVSHPRHKKKKQSMKMRRFDDGN